jgi:hypothetical protein
LFVLLSKLTSSKWNECFRLAIEKGTKKNLSFTFQLEGARKIPKAVHVFLELALDV